MKLAHVSRAHRAGRACATMGFRVDGWDGAWHDARRAASDSPTIRGDRMRTEGGGASDEASSYLDAVLARRSDLHHAGDFDGAVAVQEDNLAQARNAMTVEPQGVLTRSARLKRLGAATDRYRSADGVLPPAWTIRRGQTRGARRGRPPSSGTC